MGTALETPAWPPITLAEAAQVLARLPQGGELRRLEWHSPRPFSAAALAQTEHGTVFLKRHHRAMRSVAGLGAEHAFMRHLADRGQPVLRPLADAAGHTVLPAGEWVWEAHPLAPGDDLYRDRPSWTPFLNDRQAHAAGAALARLHRAAADHAAPARPAEPLVSSATILGSADPQAAARAYVTARPALVGWVAGRAWQDELAGVLALHDAPGVASALRTRPTLWTHNDWHPSNLTWTSGGTVAAVLDFGLADRGFALLDLAIALERSVVRWLELGEGTAPLAEMAQARTLVAGYAQEAPLDQADRALLARLLPLAHVEFALAEVDYFAGQVQRPGDAALAWQGYLIGHAAWFAGAEGQALLSAIAQEDQA
ncbi:phosphotransferase enzyme family protein [Novosphingobium capsulatum]|nr:aminoglycoside phosphotransferase family protein [Novosphingobium capsulatum]